MIDYNMPSNKRDAGLYLRAKQAALVDLLIAVEEHNLNTISQLVGIIHSESEKLTERLEEYL